MVKSRTTIRKEKKIITKPWTNDNKQNERPCSALLTWPKSKAIVMFFIRNRVKATRSIKDIFVFRSKKEIH